MVSRSYSEYAGTRLKRIGHLIEIEDPDLSVTFHPTDPDKTFAAIRLRCDELYPGYQWTEIQYRDIDTQLTEIYKDYDESRNKRKISEADHLVNLAMSRIKQQFKDQTGTFYAVIEKNGHDELLDMESEEFNRYLSKLFYDTENSVIGSNTINNSKRVIESFTTESQTLYNRIARVGNTIYYDLNNEERECVKITRDGWCINKNPLLFLSCDINRKQVYPYQKDLLIDKSRRPVRDLINRFFLKHDYQRTIAEVYAIALFIPGISLPIFLTIGPPASGKTTLLKTLRQVVDPRPFEELVERLPRDDKDRRVAICNSYFACFDNESHLSSDLMDEICAMVTGVSMSVRELYTTNEIRTFSVKRALGITGINVPITHSDALNRAFIAETESIPDGIEENTDSKLISDNILIDEIRSLTPDILAYIFDILVECLRRYDDIARQIKPNHRLADFVIWGEIISRVIGNKENEFLNAWYQNVKMQNVTVVQNNTFAALVVDYVFNFHYNQTEILIEPMQLYMDLRNRADDRKLDINRAKWFPQSPEWVTRKLQEIIMDLKAADILLEIGRDSNRRWIRFKKMQKNSKIDQ